MTNDNKNSRPSEQIKNGSIETKLQKLLNLKQKSEQVIKRLIASKKFQIEKNKKLKESLITKLNLEVVK